MKYQKLILLISFTLIACSEKLSGKNTFEEANQYFLSIDPNYVSTTEKHAMQFKNISFEDSKMDDRGLSYFIYSPNITSLNLGRTKITDVGLSHLLILKKLESLLIYQTAITCNGIKILEKLDSLTQLDISYNKGIDDSCIDNISRMKQLTSIEIGSTKISDNGFLKLRKLRPTMQVTRFEESGNY
ncbi:Leucine rich repeat protein [Leptospira santarosai]|uniref:Leucine rich repeat protein n=1 Tax=Leptospira santarosai TaxID=28183 RepID=A0A2P1QUG8_9LEPT|nr:Leucine rich repeat protein [Leptospira santarosai]